MSDNVLTPWRRFINLLKLDRRDVRQIIYYAIFAGLVSLSLPLGIQAIINLLQGAQVSTSWIILVTLVTMGVAFVGILQLMQFRISENIQQKIFTRSSFEFAYRFPKIKMSEFRNSYPPELANRFFDTLTVQKEITKILLDFPAAIIQIVFGLLLLSFYHPFFIIYGILLLLLIFFIFKYTARKGMVTSLIESKYKFKIAHWLQEIARSVVSFKLSGKTKLAMHKNDLLVSEYLTARESHFKVLVMQIIQMITFKVLVTAGLLYIGGMLVLNQEMNIGQFVAAEIIILLIINAVEKLIFRLESFYDVLTSLEKIGQVVDKDLENQEGINPFESVSTFSLDLENVGFQIPETGYKTLQNISLKVNETTRLVIQGSSGSGKSTLLKIIAGVIEQSEGMVYVNNNSMTSINPNSYRAVIGQTIPEETPFEGTILENITFGDENITNEEVAKVIEDTILVDFVKRQPLGINTMLFPEGKQMSSTVAKKIVLARSIIKKPKLLILENPLEGFNNAERDIFIKYLTRKDQPWALIVVTQDDEWSNFCKERIIMEAGKIIKTETLYA